MEGQGSSRLLPLSMSTVEASTHAEPPLSDGRPPLEPHAFDLPDLDLPQGVTLIRAEPRAAERVLRGELPHRDFGDPYTGLNAMLGAAAFRLFEAAAAGADYLFVGTIWRSGSHPGRPGAGPERIRRVAARIRAPVVAIGGVTPDRVAAAVEAGAGGVAAIRGIWGARDPVDAAGAYLEAWEEAEAMRGSSG